MFRRPGIRIWERATLDGNGDDPRVENQGDGLGHSVLFVTNGRPSQSGLGPRLTEPTRTVERKKK